MKKFTYFLAALLLSSMSVFAESITITDMLYGDPGEGYTFANKKWSAVDGNIIVEILPGCGDLDGATTESDVTAGNILSVTCKDGYKINKITTTCSLARYGSDIVAGTEIDANNYVVSNTTAIACTLVYERGGTHTFSINTEGGESNVYIQNDEYSGVVFRISSMTITYTYTPTEVAPDPTITCDAALAFGNVLSTLKNTKELAVTGTDLTEAITASFGEDAHFAVEGSLTAEGGTLTITLTATEPGDYTETLTLTAGEATATVAVTATLHQGTGTGTKDDPYTVADVIALNNETVGETAWVKGYIIGCTLDGDLVTDEESFTSNNVALGGSADATTNFIVASLAYSSGNGNGDGDILIDEDDPTGGDIITGEGNDSDAALINKAINLKENPSNLGKEILLHGTFGKYAGGFCGLFTLDDFQFLSSEGGDETAINETTTARKVTKIIENGQLVIVRDGIKYTAQGVKLN